MTRDVVLQTDRLRLREFTEADAEAFFALTADPAVTRWTGDAGLVTTLEQARAGLRSRTLADYAKHGYGRLACVLIETGAVVGFAGLKYLDDLDEIDLGYRFVPACWGRGLATEAARAILDDGFGRLGLPCIIGLADPANLASRRVLEKIGMRHVGSIEYRGRPAVKYARTAADHRAARDG